MANETLTDVFSDLADAVRAKGVTGQMTPLQMPAKVAAIPQSAIAGDPRFEVDANGNITADEFDINYFNDVIYLKRLKNAYAGCNVRSVSFPSATRCVGVGAMNGTFTGCTHLTSISFPELSTLQDYSSDFQNCFNGCTSLSSVNFPKLEKVLSENGMNSCFKGCTSLQSVSFPELSRVDAINTWSSCFEGCTSLSSVSIPKLSASSYYNNTLANCFKGCTNLNVVDIHQATSIPIIQTNTFQNTNSTFQIVVPDDLYENWIVATNWSALSSQIVKWSDYNQQ